MPKFSIISPVYNSEKFIGDTVKSVQNQTISDWQLILVDDCSTDNSVEVINALAAEDKRITVLSSDKNSGPARARNIGIDYAISHGAEYLAFIDSDDLYEPNFLEVMVGKAETENADIVWCNIFAYQTGLKNQGKIISHNFNTGLLSEHNLMLAFLDDNQGVGSMCNKIYLTSFIERQGLRINESRVRAEDWEFNLMLFQQSPRIYTINAPLYQYVHQKRASVMDTFREGDFSMYKRSLSLLEDMAYKNHLYEYMPKQYSTFVYNTICYLVLGVKTSQSKYLLKTICNDDALHKVLRSNSMCNKPTLKQRVYAILLKCKMYSLLLTMMKLMK